MTGTAAPIGEDDLQAFIDDRLTGAERERIEAYLVAHPDIAEEVAADRRCRESLRAQLAGRFAEPIPARLRIANVRSVRRALWQRRARTAAAALVIFLAGAGSGWLAGSMQLVGSGARQGAPPMTAAVFDNATAAYRTFVGEVVHPVEVKASHEAHLIKWLSKRLGRKLTAPDLSKFGYRLMGGRLLPAGSGAAAQLMYEGAAGKRLTVYVQAAHGTETAFRFREEGKECSFAWIDRGFGFAVTARMGRNALLPLADAVYRSLEDARRSGASGKDAGR